MPATLQPPTEKRSARYDPVFRFTVAQYQRMIAEGIISADAKVELLNGKVVNKMARNPPHDATLGLTQSELASTVGADWLIRTQMAVVIGQIHQPEPDIAVVLAPWKRYMKQHPVVKDIGMLAEIADSTLLSDRREKVTIYAAGRIPWYWIVNLPEQIVEVYSDPKGGASPAFRKREDYKPGDKLAVVLRGKVAGRIEVANLFLEAGD